MFDKTQVDNLMKNAQEMQQNLQKAQDQIAKIEMEGHDEKKNVKVIMNCRHDLKSVSIEPSAMNDRVMLEKMFAAAVNDATKKIEAYTANKMMDGISSGILNGLSEIKLPI
jgi:nucleoid-associated protein EbfC